MNIYLLTIIGAVIFGSTLMGCSGPAVKSDSQITNKNGPRANRVISSRRECILTDARIVDVLSAHTELVTELENKKYKLSPDALPVNIDLTASIVQSGCHDETLKCSYTCQVQLTINDSPFNEIVGQFGRKFWSQSPAFFTTSESSKEETTVRSSTEASNFIMDHMISGNINKHSACMLAAVKAIKSVPSCNIKTFYKYSR